MTLHSVCILESTVDRGWLGSLHLTASPVIVISGQSDIPIASHAALSASSYNNMRSRGSGRCPHCAVSSTGPRSSSRGPSCLIKRSSIIVQLCRLINPPAIMLPPLRHPRFRPVSLDALDHLDHRVSCSARSDPSGPTYRSSCSFLPRPRDRLRGREGRRAAESYSPVS